MKKTAIVQSISGSVIKATGHAAIREMVYVGSNYLPGEVINIGDKIVVQVFEDTTGLTVGDPVYGSGAPLSITLGPWLLGGVFDGTGRNLQNKGDFLRHSDHHEAEKKYYITFLVKDKEHILPNTKIAMVQETALVVHYIISPFGGYINFLARDGEYTPTEKIAEIDKAPLTLQQNWPVKRPRPFLEKLPPSSPLITGQRIIDTFFPVALGGTAAIPGGFGTGKTLAIHQIAKHAHADILIYIGCGERGNEIKGILDDFAQLQDPSTGRPLMERTVIIANTSNMPVSAREASIYTGITIAEYYRDMGYHVALMADSTSRFAEGLRELSASLGEMPAEEGYPAYLPARLASFYERGGLVQTLCGNMGSVTIIGSVSPQGGDMNDIVTLHTKRYVRCFWELDRGLASRRHFPAINWINSYSEYIDELSPWYHKNSPRNFLSNRKLALELLQTENRLQEIVKLIGEDVLHDSQKLVLATCETLRQGFLAQNALIKMDSYTPPDIQAKLIEIILYLHRQAEQLISMHIPLSVIRATGIFRKCILMKDEGFEHLRSNEKMSHKEQTTGSGLNQYFGIIDSILGKIKKEYDKIWQ